MKTLILAVLLLILSNLAWWHSYSKLAYHDMRTEAELDRANDYIHHGGEQ